MPVKAMDLFDAYEKSQLPKDHGFIVSSFFSSNSAYSRYEVVSYNNVKSIYPSGEGLTFQTDGKKLFILVEPQNYAKKSEEPYVRSSTEQIPSGSASFTATPPRTRPGSTTARRPSSPTEPSRS
ncbi:MAG: hypothetical protein MZV70_06025 [Desulfobacterales bacterium]|nr:hypothetical protein [Desulfobacterales bacterium]